MNSNPRNAWELYLKMDTSNESFNLLQLIANDCYRMGQFLYAAKAFDVLERLDPDPEYWEGKRGACGTRATPRSSTWSASSTSGARRTT